MTLARIFDDIEASDLTAAVNVASGRKLAMKVAMNHPLVKKLRTALPRRGGGEAILGRLTEVAGRAVDPRFENPYDAALMTYLLLLESINPVLAQIGSADVLQVPNIWWAGSVAIGIAGARRSRSDAGSTLSEGEAAREVTNTAASEGRAIVGTSTIVRGRGVVFSGAAPSSSGSSAATNEVRIPAAKPGVRFSSNAWGAGARAA